MYLEEVLTRSLLDPSPAQEREEDAARRPPSPLDNDDDHEDEVDGKEEDGYAGEVDSRKTRRGSRLDYQTDMSDQERPVRRTRRMRRQSKAKDEDYDGLLTASQTCTAEEELEDISVHKEAPMGIESQGDATGPSEEALEPIYCESAQGYNSMRRAQKYKKQARTILLDNIPMNVQLSEKKISTKTTIATSSSTANANRTIKKRLVSKSSSSSEEEDEVEDRPMFSGAPTPRGVGSRWTAPFREAFLPRRGDRYPPESHPSGAPWSSAMKVQNATYNSGASAPVRPLPTVTGSTSRPSTALLPSPVQRNASAGTSSGIHRTQPLDKKPSHEQPRRSFPNSTHHVPSLSSKTTTTAPSSSGALNSTTRPREFPPNTKPSMDISTSSYADLPPAFSPELVSEDEEVGRGGRDEATDQNNRTSAGDDDVEEFINSIKAQYDQQDSAIETHQEIAVSSSSLGLSNAATFPMATVSDMFSSRHLSAPNQEMEIKTTGRRRTRFSRSADFEPMPIGSVDMSTGFIGSEQGVTAVSGYGDVVTAGYDGTAANWMGGMHGNNSDWQPHDGGYPCDDLPQIGLSGPSSIEPIAPGMPAYHPEPYAVDRFHMSEHGEVASDGNYLFPGSDANFSSAQFHAEQCYPNDHPSSFSNGPYNSSFPADPSYPPIDTYPGHGSFSSAEIYASDMYRSAGDPYHRDEVIAPHGHPVADNGPSAYPFPLPMQIDHPGPSVSAYGYTDSHFSMGQPMHPLNQPQPSAIGFNSFYQMQPNREGDSWGTHPPHYHQRRKKPRQVDHSDGNAASVPMIDIDAAFEEVGQALRRSEDGDGTEAQEAIASAISQPGGGMNPPVHTAQSHYRGKRKPDHSAKQRRRHTGPFSGPPRMDDGGMQHHHPGPGFIDQYNGQNTTMDPLEYFPPFPPPMGPVGMELMHQPYYPAMEMMAHPGVEHYLMNAPPLGSIPSWPQQTPQIQAPAGPSKPLEREDGEVEEGELLE